MRLVRALLSVTVIVYRLLMLNNHFNVKRSSTAALWRVHLWCVSFMEQSSNYGQYPKDSYSYQLKSVQERGLFCKCDKTSKIIDKNEVIIFK